MGTSSKNTGEGVSSRSGTAPPAEYRWKPGQSGNPAGRTAGACLKEWLNVFCQQDLTEDALRAIVRDKTAPYPKRAAAVRALRMIEVPDLADFGPVLDGRSSLDELRAEGIDTSMVKKCKERRTTYGKNGENTEITREIELFDRSGEEFDRVVDRTDGKPAQSVRVAGALPTAVRFLFGDEKAPEDVQE